MPKEPCLVIPRRDLISNGILPPESETEGKYTYTRLTGDRPQLANFLRVKKATGHFGERTGEKNVENDPTEQQIIMYAFVTDKEGRWLLAKRAGKGNYDESRLAGRVAGGISGHIGVSDKDLTHAFYREMAEEAVILVDGQPVNFVDQEGQVNYKAMMDLVSIRATGLIKDERDEVGKVHMGLACRLIPRRENVEIRVKTGPGEENESFMYVTPQEYEELRDSGQIQPEGWTDIIYREEIKTSN